MAGFNKPGLQGINISWITWNEHATICSAKKIGESRSGIRFHCVVLSFVVAGCMPFVLDEFLNGFFAIFNDFILYSL